MSCSWALKDFPNSIMIETGSCMGDGVATALNLGFTKIYSIEIDRHRHDYCVSRFKNNLNVRLYLGDSIDVLPDILRNIHESCTFLLDAHISKLDQLHGKLICPLLEEIKIIAKHGLENKIRHKLIIDDKKFLNGMNESFNNLTVKDVEKILFETDSAYKITYYRKYIAAI